MSDSYQKVQQDISRMLKSHHYSFQDLVKIVGCGDKTIRRYLDRGLIRPVTTGAYSNSQYFAQEELERAIFIYDIFKATKMDGCVSAALYDYLKAKRIRFDMQNFLDRVEDYKNDRGT